MALLKFHVVKATNKPTSWHVSVMNLFRFSRGLKSVVHSILCKMILHLDFRDITLSCFFFPSVLFLSSVFLSFPSLPDLHWVASRNCSPWVTSSGLMSLKAAVWKHQQRSRFANYQKQLVFFIVSSQITSSTLWKGNNNHSVIFSLQILFWFSEAF